MTWKLCDRSWNSLEQSRRIGKSLERVRVRSDVKEHGFLMVYA